MKLYFSGHDYKYAAEQILLMMFPWERPEYPEDKYKKQDNSAFISLSESRVWATARTFLSHGGKEAFGVSRVKCEELSDKLSRDRLLQKIIKLSFYKAAVTLTGKNPVWGALTGIRPGKIVSNLIEAGASDKKAVSVMKKEYFVTDERASLCLDTAKAGLIVKNSLKPNDIASYIGIPFCPTRCAYCSFVSHSVEKSMKLIPPFLEALFKEIEETAKLVKEMDLNVISVYIGGGTPTTLSASELTALLKKVEEHFDLSNCREYTVEAGRPDTITEDKLLALKEMGISRISINPQTMSDEVLKVIGRRHTAEDIFKSYDMAVKTGMDCINMDLIAGLPSDTPEGFYDTLDKVLALEPKNITVHTLSLKKGTKITLEGTPIPSDEDVGKMLDYAASRLREKGYKPYYLYRQKFMAGGFENVGWCKDGYDSLYNILIMEELCTILALGGGGSTKLVAPKIGKINRIFNAKYPHEYINGIENIIKNKENVKEFYRNEVF